MLRIGQFSQPERPAWSALSIVAVLLSAWAAATVAGAIAAAQRFAKLGDFSVLEVLVAAWPYAAALLLLLVLLAVLCSRRGAWASQAQFVKLGIIVAILAGATAWLLVAYPAVFSELRTGS